MASDLPALEPLDPELVPALAKAAAFPDDPSAAARGVEHVQTHLSHVFLTADRVYKLHKAVRFGFVDFATRAARSQDSLREVALNRRLAPDVYLGVAAVCVVNGSPCVGPVTETLTCDATSTRAPEHCVVMRRLPGGRDALSLLEKGELGAAHVDAIALAIADFHARSGLGEPAPFEAEVWQERLRTPVMESFESLTGGLLADRARAAKARALTAFMQRAQQLETRRRQGRVVDGHGDLHLQHLWFERDADPPLAIDCLEFRDDYRQIDAASEVAFLAMDLEYRGRRDLGERFLRRYAEARDDFDLYGVVDLFFAYRAAVRAKVADLATRDAGVPAPQRARSTASAAAHLALAEDALAAPRRGALVLMAGIVGSGKSSAAQALADRTGGVVICSDRVRKRQAGLAATARGHAELYTDARTEAAYAGLLERAAPVVLSGRVAILDATFARASFRAEARAWADGHAVRSRLVETVCAAPETRARLTARQRDGADPSDAGPELLDASVAGFQPVDEWPAQERTRIATDRAGWSDVLADALHALELGEVRPRGAAART